MNSRESTSIETLRFNIDRISEKVNELQLNYYKKDVSIVKALLSHNLGSSLNEVNKLMGKIQDLYKQFLRMSRKKNIYPDEFVDNLINPKISYNDESPWRLLQ